MWTWTESTSLAITIRDSLLLTALLSGIHVVGMTIVTGGALVRALQPADRRLTLGIRGGVLVSVASGLLLAMPRAGSAVGNGYFDAKMALLALAFLAEWVRRSRASTTGTGPPGGPNGPVAGRGLLMLWAGVAALGCAYILLE